MAIMKIKSTHPESQGLFVEIEADNFNADTMEEYVEGDESGKSLSVAEIKEQLYELGVEIPAGSKKAELKALLDATLAA